MAPAYVTAFLDNPAFLAAVNVARPVALANGVTATDDDLAIIATAVLAAFAEEGGFDGPSRRAIKAASADMLRELMAHTPPPGRSPCPTVPLRVGGLG